MLTGAEVLRLMNLRIAGLFRCDAAGRMVAVNQWNGGRPPRFHLGRTRAGNLCRVREDVPPAAARELLALAAEESPLDDPRAPPVQMGQYLRVLGCGEVRADPAEVTSGPVYWFDRDIEPEGDTVGIDPRNASLLRGCLDQWRPDVPHRQPMVAVIEEGRAVAVCASVRITAHAHEAGVETHPDFRRRGYATCAVAGWARAVRQQSAAERFYSTSWGNVASRQVAARLGVVLVGADFSIS